MVRLLAVLPFALALLSAQSPPNVLLIVSDDQGYNDLGAQGSTEIHTPRLDQLAAEGVRLTSYYAGFPVCTPSRGAMLTGRYPQRNGTYDNFRNDRADDDYLYPAHEYELSPERVLGMDLREVLLSQVLKKGGYRTGMFGKWDLGQLRRFLPMQRGFDDFYGFVNTGVDYYTHERYGVPSMYDGNRPTVADKGTYTTDLFERETLRFLSEDSDKPWFVYLSYNAPHGASNLDRAIRGSAQAPGKFLDLYPSGESLRAQKRRKFMAAVTAMDASIGRVLDHIDKAGQRDDTLVIFVSDNGGGGGGDNTPLRGRKNWMFEGGVRVPGLVRFPGRIPEGRVSDGFISALDWFPTVVAAAGLRPPADVPLDGFNMLPVLAGEQESPREEMFWERQGDFGARVGQWKWVVSRRGNGLFDLSEDVGEQNDLSGKLPDVLRRVRGRYEAWKAAMEQSEPRGPYRDF